MKTIKKIDLRVRREKLAESREPYCFTISTPDELARIARSVTTGSDRETFLVFPCDVKNKVLGYVEVALGSVDACPVDPREVFRATIVMGASGLFIAHNHPSGDESPSSEDIELTKRIVDGGAILGLPVLDHLIITDSSYFSFAEKGMLATVKELP